MITEWGKRMKRTIAHILVVTMMINAMSLPVYAEADHDVEKQVVTDSEKSEEIDGNIKPEEVTNEIQEDEALNNNNEIKEAESEESEPENLGGNTSEDQKIQKQENDKLEDTDISKNDELIQKIDQEDTVPEEIIEDYGENLSENVINENNLENVLESEEDSSLEETEENLDENAILNISENISNLNIWDGTVSDTFSSGEGTQENPYIICNGAELAHLASEIKNKRGNSAYYELKNDIYLNNVSDEKWYMDQCNEWIPIGTLQDPGSTVYNIHMEYEFTGHFDGKGHTVYGVFIDGTENGVGLFGSVENAEISNVNLEKSYIAGENYVGGLVGSSHFFNKIRNCHVNAQVYGNDCVGGIAGGDYCGTYQGCSNSGVINGSTNVGGITGKLGNGSASVERCYNTGKIYGKENVGGITGIIKNYDGSSYISNSYNAGEINGEEKCVGGITGYLDANRSIQYCYNVGKITCAAGENRVGALIGFREFIAGVSNCYYLDTSYKTGTGTGSHGSNAGTECTMEEMQLTGTFKGFDFDNLWYIHGTEGYIYPQLHADGERWYAKLLLIDGKTGEPTTDYQITVENSNDLDGVVVEQYGYVVGRYSAYQSSAQVVISKNGYKNFIINASDLNISISVLEAENNVITLEPDSEDISEEEKNQMQFVADHLDFAQNRYDSFVNARGFKNAYWQFDNGDEFALCTVANWMKNLTNVSDILDFQSDNIKISVSYYDIYLADLITSMSETSTAETDLGLSGFEMYKECYGNILDNWIVKFASIDIKKNDLFSAEEKQEWDNIIAQVTTNVGDLDSKEFRNNLENLLAGSQKGYEVDDSVKKLISFVASPSFYKKYEKEFSDIFEGLEVANEASTYICNAADAIKAFQTVSQAYIAAKTVKKMHTEFYDILYKVRDEMNSKNQYQASAFSTALNKYAASANNDAALYMNCIEELTSSVIDFTYDSFIKKYIQKSCYDEIANFLGCTPGMLKAVVLAYKLGYAIGDKITDLSTKADQYTNMYYVSTVEEALENVSKKYGDILIQNQTYEDAKIYDCAYKMLAMTNKYLYNCMYKMSASDKGLKIGDKHFFRVPELMKLGTIYTNMWNRNKCHGKVLTNRYKYTSIQCPVDVYIYDAQNQLVLSIINEQVELNDDELYVMVSNGKKSIIYPYDQEYQIKLVARESGLMDYYVAEITDTETRNIDFYSIPLEEEKEYTGVIPAGIPVESSEYMLHTDGNDVQADYDSSEECLPTPSTCNWEGTTANWEKVSDAEKYVVYLYKDGQILKIVEAADNDYDFAKNITDPGLYAFSIVAVSGIPEYKNSRRTIPGDILQYVKISGVESVKKCTYNRKSQLGYEGNPSSTYEGTYQINYSGRKETVYQSNRGPVDAGDYTVTIAIPGDNSHYAGSISLDFSIEKADSNLRVEKTYISKSIGDADFCLSYSTDNLETLPTFKSDNEKIVKVGSDGKVSIVGEGDATITVSQEESKNYNAAACVVKIEVNKAATNLIEKDNNKSSEKEKVKNSRTSETIESKDESNYFVESAETSDTNFVGGWLLILALSMWSIGINIQRKRKN